MVSTDAEIAVVIRRLHLDQRRRRMTARMTRRVEIRVGWIHAPRAIDRRQGVPVFAVLRHLAREPRLLSGDGFVQLPTGVRRPHVEADFAQGVAKLLVHHDRQVEGQTLGKMHSLTGRLAAAILGAATAVAEPGDTAPRIAEWMLRMVQRRKNCAHLMPVLPLYESCLGAVVPLDGPPACIALDSPYERAAFRFS